MKTLLNTWFLASCLLWLIVLITRHAGHPLPYLNGYLSDVVAIPVIANLGLWFQRQFIIKSNHYILAAGHVLFIVAYVSMVFEWLLPHFSAIYTADQIDVLLYILGGVFFYRVMNKPLAETVTRS